MDLRKKNSILNMKNLFRISIFLMLFVLLSSMAVHKFYVAIYKVEFAPQKKMLQITTRIFVDDLNHALEKKYNKKTYLGEDKESENDLILLKKYLAEKFTIKVNGELKTMNFLSKELENNVLICYFNSKEITKIKTLEIQNSVLTEVYDEQQNIIQANFNGEKHSLLLTSENIKGMLK